MDRPNQKRLVLLIRHASRARKWKLPESAHSMNAWDPDYYFEASQAGKPGLPITLGLAGQLCDQLEIENVRVNEIFHSEHKVARQTAMALAHVLNARTRATIPIPYKVCLCLTPESSFTKIETIRAQLESWAKNATVRKNATVGENANVGENLACVLIGHQPQLTDIAKQLLRKPWSQNKFLKFFCELGLLNDNSLPANILPLGSSEVACIELGNKPRLVWLMTEKSTALLTELKAKIASKYDVAKFFLGALVVGTGLTLTESVWGLTDPIDKAIAGAGAFAALVSLGLTAATLFSYDRLMMPQDFWGGSEQKGEKRPWFSRWLGGNYWSVSRPPGQAHVILFYEMVHIWTHLFIPAIVSAFAAVGLVVIAQAHDSISLQPEVWWLFPEAGQGLLVFALFVVALVAFFVGIMAFYLWKPRLGFDD